MQDWDVLWFRIPLGAWQWKAEAQSPKWETLSKARFWTAMGNTHPKHGSSMDLGRLCARLASPLTEVKSTESGKVDVVNIVVTGKVVKLLCAPYKDPQDPLNFLEALDTDMITQKANPADGADLVSPVVMAKLIDNPESVLVVYGEVESVWDALQTVLDAPGIAENDYWYEKVQVCCWLPGAGKTGTCRIQAKALVLLAGVRMKKKVCTTLLDLRRLAMPLQSRYSSVQIPPYIGSGRRERDEPGSMPLVLYTWMATLMQTKDCTEKVMIFDHDVHMAAKVVALGDPPQVSSLQLTKQNRSDRARSYHHEGRQRVHAGIDQTRLAHCELWIQFGMPMWVEDKHVGYAHLEVSAAEEPSQHAHVEVADEYLEDPGDDDDEPLLTGSDRQSPRKSMQVRAFQDGDADEDEPRASQAPKPKKQKTQAAAEPKQTTLTQPQGLKRTLSLPDPGTVVGSTSRSKMLAAGLKQKKKP